MTDKTTEQPAKISTGGVKKGRNQGEKIITSNRLVDGFVVYYVTGTTWTEDLAKATVYEGDAAMDALKITTAQETIVVGPYLMDVEVQDGKIIPDGRGRIREEIRKLGPTTRTDHGRQAWGIPNENGASNGG